MRPITVSLGPYAAAVANGITTAQTLSQAGPFAINGSLTSGGVAILDNPRQIAFTSAGNDSSVVFSVSGLDGQSNPLGEQVRGANVGTVVTNNLFKRVTGVSASNATSSVTIGTAAAPFFSRAIRLDEWADTPVSVSVVAVGTANFTVQHSFDEGPDSLTNPIPLSAMVWESSLVPVQGVSGIGSSSFALPATPLWLRLVLNSGSGSVRMVAVQPDVVNA